MCTLQLMAAYHRRHPACMVRTHTHTNTRRLLSGARVLLYHLRYLAVTCHCRFFFAHTSSFAQSPRASNHLFSFPLLSPTHLLPYFPLLLLLLLFISHYSLLLQTRVVVFSSFTFFLSSVLLDLTAVSMLMREH
jgi:hypothetical protein